MTVDWASQPIVKAAFARSRETLAEAPRQVATFQFANHSHDLILGPLKSGGFCLALTGPYGGTACPFRQRQPGPTVSSVADGSGPIAVEAVFESPAVAKAIIHFADGRQMTVSVVWVTQPIAAGFLYSAVPPAQRRSGHRPTSVRFLDVDGHVVSRATLP